MQDRYLVLTPEKVIVSYVLGGIGSRILAHLIDVLLYVAVTVALGMLIALAGAVFMELASVALLIIATFGYFAYFIAFEGFWQGMTPGKKVLKLRVLNVDGTPIGIREAILRNLLRPADMLPVFYLFGLVTIFINPRGQRIGDLVSGTVVVKVPERRQGYTPAPHHVGIHPIEDSIGELTGMTLEEYHAIKRLCDRFPYLTGSEQQESVETIWKPFAERENIQPLANVHPVYQMEAVVMKYGRMKKLV